MDPSEVLRRFDNLSIWKQGDQYAPGKPLLVPYALGRLQKGQKEGPRVHLCEQPGRGRPG